MTVESSDSIRGNRQVSAIIRAIVATRAGLMPKEAQQQVDLFSGGAVEARNAITPKHLSILHRVAVMDSCPPWLKHIADLSAQHQVEDNS